MSTPLERARALFGHRADDALERVDEQGTSLGSVTLAEAHMPPGQLHRAFSVYLFDAAGRLMVHRRHPDKALWGGHWTNSCCSHPYLGEAVREAAIRRIGQELGLDDSEPEELFRYTYRAAFGDLGVEHEHVHVFRLTADPKDLTPHPGEMDAVRWLEPAEVTELLASDEPTTPWFALAWPRL